MSLRYIVLNSGPHLLRAILGTNALLYPAWAISPC